MGRHRGEKVGIVKARASVVSWAAGERGHGGRGRGRRDGLRTSFVPDSAISSVEPLAETALRRFSWKGRGFETRLLGSYQPFNAALALTAVDVLRGRGWAISDEAAFAGIASARWPGRFEVVDTAPLTIVDGGHNLPGGRVSWGRPGSPIFLGRDGTSVDFALGVLADKDYPAMVRAVAPWARSFSVYAPKSPRALAAEELRPACARLWWKRAGPMTCPCARAALPLMKAPGAARDAAGPEGCVVAFGTLYAIADLMGAL